ncbi:MAG: methylated-DNA--[protein]-cysteine S-methyltransferase [Spirochaetes bacterium]|nr:methylated-DNA--[protein]-cysteine S-methyltransferase [Spirochaetota bacterium]
MKENFQNLPNLPVIPNYALIEILPQNNSTADRFMSINYSFAEVFFGKILICSTSLGICYLAIVNDETASLSELQERFPGSLLINKTDEIQQSALKFINCGKRASVKLHIKGTEFQLSVWNELLNIPFGFLSSYGDIAKKIGRPGSSRAIGSAIGQNPVAYIIPCHRVIRKNGDIGGYRWGVPIKKKLIECEISIKNNN